MSAVTEWTDVTLAIAAIVSAVLTAVLAGPAIFAGVVAFRQLGNLRSQLEEARNSRESSLRPALVVVGLTRIGSELELTLRNVGPGPALSIMAAVAWLEPGAEPQETWPQLSGRLEQVAGQFAQHGPQVEFPIGAIAAGADETRPSLAPTPVADGLSAAYVVVRYEDVFQNVFGDELFTAMQSQKRTNP